MSNEAINWALTRPIKHSTAKFVLVVMANCAHNQSWTAWPSVAHLAESTGQDRKTILENIKRLVAMGYIEDTGERKGATKQVPVYRLKNTENGTVKESFNDDADQVEQSQKRDSTENGTVPIFPSNSPVFPVEQSRFSAETVPKTGHGTIIEPSIEPSIDQKKRDKAAPFVLPDWVPAEAWAGYIEMRKKKRKDPTEYARDLVIKELQKLRAAGHDLQAVLDSSTKNGWTDVYAPKPAHQARAGPSYQSSIDKHREIADRLTGRHHENRPDIVDIN